MEREDTWKRLVGSLDAWTWATETAPGRIEVSVPRGGGSRHVLIVMTPDEWDDMASVMWGNYDDAVADVKRTLLALRPEEGFAVYSDYRLEPSTAAALPEPPEFIPEPGGGWVTYDREGNMTSRLADWTEPDVHP